jgi:hypothetical protein
MPLAICMCCLRPAIPGGHTCPEREAAKAKQEKRKAKEACMVLQPAPDGSLPIIAKPLPKIKPPRIVVALRPSETYAPQDLESQYPERWKQ